MRLLHIPTATEYEWASSERFKDISEDSSILINTRSGKAFFIPLRFHLTTSLEPDEHGLALVPSYTLIELPEIMPTKLKFWKKLATYLGISR